MAKGENIFKRKDGRWEARYKKGYTPEGKIKYGFCYGKTYREAKEKVTRCKSALLENRHDIAFGGRKRFSYYCDEWLKYKKHTVKESTFVKYGTIVEKHIKPILGNVLTQNITTAVIDGFSQELLYNVGLSAKSVHDILMVVSGILKYIARYNNGIVMNIEINYPKETRKEMRVLSRSEQSEFIKYLLKDMDSCKFGLLLALLTGIRIGELCALQWKNISLTDKTVRIVATLQRLQNVTEGQKARTKVIIGDPKSGMSARVIPMTDFLCELCERMKPTNPEIYVLTGSTCYMEPRVLQYRIEKYTAECGLSGVHCHTLRHTFATRAVEAGFEIKSLSEILGHSTTAITLERYVHSSMQLKRDNMQKLSAIGF